MTIKIIGKTDKDKLRRGQSVNLYLIQNQRIDS